METRGLFQIFRPSKRELRSFKTKLMDSTRQKVHNMTGNCLFYSFLVKYIHIYSYIVKKRDSYKIFRLRMKILWEPGSPSLSHPGNKMQEIQNSLNRLLTGARKGTPIKELWRGQAQFQSCKCVTHLFNGSQGDTAWQARVHC